MDNDQRISDEQLVAKVAAGDMDALACLVGRHQQRVLGLAYRMVGQWQEAEDIAQEAFIRVYRSADRYRPEARFTTWLYRVVVNLCHDSRRRSRRRPVALDGKVTEDLKFEQPDEMDQREQIQQVQRAIGKLSTRQRTAVVLHRYENMTHHQIAEVTGWSESAVESLIVRGYKKLRNLLSDPGK